MERAGSGNEIRRILLLTRIRESPKGLTLNQVVKDCAKVEGWDIIGMTLWEGVRFVLQSLIDDELVTLKTRFLITPKGREYLTDPLKWQVKVETTEETERKMFWSNIYRIFDKAFARLGAKSQSEVLRDPKRENRREG